MSTQTETGQTNASLLRDAEDTQQKTKEAVERIKNQTNDTLNLGNATLEELRAQSRQMDDINMEVTNVNAKLDTASSLQDKFDAWSGFWFGGKKRAANAEAAAEIAQREASELAQTKEVFEQQKFETIKRTWKPSGFVHCSNPSKEAPELFDPSNPASMQGSKWTIDFNLSGIDAEGWTYAYDFATLNKSGAGSPEAKWNTYVRRRKWKYVERTGNAGLEDVKQRQRERNEKNSNKPQSGAERVGYVARNNNFAVKESGFVSANGTKKDEQLDEESKQGLARIKANDEEIDRGLASISSTLDSINVVAAQMNEETRNQNKKLLSIEDNMNTASNKQAVVNARQKKYLN